MQPSKEEGRLPLHPPAAPSGEPPFPRATPPTARPVLHQPPQHFHAESPGLLGGRVACGPLVAQSDGRAAGQRQRQLP